MSTGMARREIDVEGGREGSLQAIKQPSPDRIVDDGCTPSDDERGGVVQESLTHPNVPPNATAVSHQAGPTQCAGAGM